MNKFKLQTHCLNNIEINSKELSLINYYSEIKETLNIFHNKKISSLNFLYSNRTNIKKIVGEADEIIKINKVDVMGNYLQYFFYLFYIITEDIYNINYSYDFDLIKELYNRMTEEKQTIRKFILYILAYPIVYNYEGIDESNSSEELEKIYIEIYQFMINQHPLLENYNLNLDLSNYKSFNIDDIYCQFIISLIRNEKLKNFNETNDIMEQLDLENIELTHDMYINLKKEFDDNSNKKYIAQYKIVNSENIKKFINEDFINFNFIILKYVFKNTIYIYIIDFFLENRKSLMKIVKNYYEKLFFDIDNIKNVEYKEKVNYVLKQFLDSSYNYIINKYKRCSKKINQDEVINIILQKINEKLENASPNQIKIIWKGVEKCIHDKKVTKIRFRNKIFTIFNEPKNKEYFLQIFNNEEIDFFIDRVNKINDLTEIYTYYKNYCFESKKNDISKINDFLRNNTDLIELNKYIKDLNLAKKMNIKFPLIKYIFNYDEKNGKDEGKLKSYIKELDEIGKKLIDKKELDDNIKIKIFKFFDTERKEKKFNDIFNKDAFNFFIEKKKEAINEILNYYIDFFPESKINEKANLDDYSKAKKMNKIKPLIFLLMDNKDIHNERDIKSAIKKWNKIEINFNNNNFQNIDEEDKNKLINIFNDPKNEVIKEIFDKEQIKDFIEKKNKYI